MALADDETIAEQVSEQTKSDDRKTEALGFPPAPSLLLPPPAPVPLESGMDTGQGADDEPELAIGDRHMGDAQPLTPDEAKRLLGDKSGYIRPKQGSGKKS